MPARTVAGDETVAADETVAVAADETVAVAADETEAGDEDPWLREVELLLAERAAFSPDPTAPVEVTLPGHLSVSQLVALRRDPQALARSLRRPLPARPDPYARRGTAFHTWLERRFGSDQLLDVDELPGAADEDAAPDDALAELRERFDRSEWADRVPHAVEVAFATTVAGVVIRGRMDAVYADPDGGFDVVDWKTGHRPAAGRDADAAAVQLAAYRLAWAELAGIPVGRVRAAFHYVVEGVTVRPADLLDARGLTELLARLPRREPTSAF
jgi:DNA helicase II / ATP-dependent DNA helicase PcrA